MVLLMVLMLLDRILNLLLLNQNIHLHNAAIQEFVAYPANSQRVFPGAQAPEIGYFYPSEEVGIGVGFDQQAADEFPVVYRPHEWTQSRLPNGVIHTP